MRVYLKYGFVFCCLAAVVGCDVEQLEKWVEQQQKGKKMAQITVNVGDDLQALVNANPDGTTFLIKSGEHRMQQVIPKADVTFVGENGAILNGSRLLTSWSWNGSYWVHGGQTQEGPHYHGSNCVSGIPCEYPEDLFMDDWFMTQVHTLGEVTSGKWYFDFAADTIYMADNPSGHKMEIGVSQFAIGYPEGYMGMPEGPDDAWRVKNVVIKNLIVEKYACPGQWGAIGNQYPGKDWIVEDCEVRLNHGCGIDFNGAAVIRNNNVHHNGQIGITGIGDSAVIENNEISYNCVDEVGFDWGWEGGGTKFARCTNLIVRGNFVHHNKGAGLWTDIDNRDVLYEDNVVEDNLHDGIFHEISYSAIIRNNKIRRNATGNRGQYYGAQITIANSQDVEIYGNEIIADSARSDDYGVLVLNHNRGGGAFGTWRSYRVYVHDNEIDCRSSNTINGGYANWDVANFWANGEIRFDKNNYKLNSLSANRFAWSSGLTNWAGFQAAGQEASGSATVKTFVDLNVGDNFQTKVNANGANAYFVIKAGEHRSQQAIPKTGQTFVGDSGAIVNGSVLLTSWTWNGSQWWASASGQSPRIINGECNGYPFGTGPCTLPEDLYMDDNFMSQVESLGALSSGKFYFDYGASRVYIVDDPSGHKMEFSSKHFAFGYDTGDLGNKPQNVTIKNLIIEKYACPAQCGAIGYFRPADGWVVEDNEIRLNHGVGVKFRGGAVVRNNHIHHNGQMGIGCGDANPLAYAVGPEYGWAGGNGGTGSLVEKNEINNNGVLGFNPGWEAGGSKFGQATNLTIKENSVHHNNGFGLWGDFSFSGTVYEDNVVENNTFAGIHHEISDGATIVGNKVRGNGKDGATFRHDVQIAIINSSGVEVKENEIIAGDVYGSGIVLRQDDRNREGVRMYTHNTYVHHNKITFRGSSNNGLCGGEASYDRNDFWVNGNNHFDYNTYFVDNLSSNHWRWDADASETWPPYMNFAGFQAEGEEAHGTATQW